MKPRLNLATKPLENKRRFFAAALGLGVPALLLFAALVGAAYSDWRSTRERRAEVASLDADLRDYQHRRAELEKSFADPATKRIIERATFLNGLIEQRSFPWTKLFMDLEHQLPAGVHVLNLSPRMFAGGVEVQMTVAATNDLAKLEFLRTLESSSEFTHLLVVSESHPSRQESSTDTVQVELVARYGAGDEPNQAVSAPAEKPLRMFADSVPVNDAPAKKLRQPARGNRAAKKQ